MATTFFDPNAQATYSLWLKSPAGQLLQVIDDFFSLELVRVTNDIGSLKVKVEKAEILDDFLQPDGIIEVWRKLTGTKRAYLEGDTQWRIRKTREISTQEGTTLEIIALDNQEILNRAVVAYYSGSAETSKSGAAGSVMREMVYENMDATGATDADRWLSGGYDGAFFQVEADRGLGETVAISDTVGRKILSQLQKIAAQSKELGTYMFFDVVVVSGNLLEFRTYEQQRGNDHGAGSGQEIILDEKSGALQNAVRTINHTNSFSVAYALGGGEQDQRTIGTATNAALIALSPFGRIEASRDSRQITLQATLDDVAEEFLRSGNEKTVINGKLVDGALRYGVDYYFGDRLLIGFGNQTYTGRVNGIKITAHNGIETINAALEVET